MNPILNVKSIRYGQVHIDPATGEQTALGSKNKAKAHSRRLGGAGAVIAARSADHLNQVRAQWKVADLEVRIELVEKDLADAVVEYKAILESDPKKEEKQKAAYEQISSLEVRLAQLRSELSKEKKNV